MSGLLANPDLLFHLVAGVVLLVGLGAVVHAWPQAGVALLVATLALSTDLRDPVFAPQVSVADGVQVGLLDVLAATMLVSAIVRVATGHARAPHLVPIWVLVGLMALNIMRGVHEHGLQLALNEARPWVYLLAAVAYCAGSPIRSARWWTGLGLVYCSWLLLRIIAGLAVTGLQPVTSYIEVDGRLVDPRPVTAAAAVVLAQVLLVLVAARTRRRRDLAAVLALGIVLLLIQHRTVWFAAAGGLVYVASRALRDGGQRRLAALLAIGGLLSSGVLALMSGVVQGSAVALSAENVAASDNTFVWRVTGWRVLMHEQLTAVGAVMGNPFGSGFSRVVDGRLLAVSPHSHYVETILRFGLAGFVAWIVIVVAAWRAASTLEVPAPAVRSALIVLTVFAVTYRCDPVQGILLGTVLGLSAARPREEPAQLGAPSVVVAVAR